MTRSTLQQVRRTLPPLSARGQAIVDALLLTGGPIGTAQRVAPRLGLRNRFELARLLKRDGLPPLHELAAWATILAWLETAERTQYSLCRLAFRCRKDPAVCYRTVKRITGLGWREVRLHGSEWLIGQFAARVRHASSSFVAHVGDDRSARY